MARNDEIKKTPRNHCMWFPKHLFKILFPNKYQDILQVAQIIYNMFLTRDHILKVHDLLNPTMQVFFIKDHILKVHNLLNLTMHELMEHNMWTCWKHQVPAYSKVKVHEHRMVSSVQLNHDFFCIIFMAPSLASLSAASFPSTPLWPGTCFCQMKKIVNPYTDRQA